MLFIFKWIRNFARQASLAALLAASLSVASGQTTTITSPDGTVIATVTGTGGTLSYTVSYRGSTAIETSTLGLTVSGYNLGSGTTITGTTSYSANETFASRYAVHATATNYYNAKQIAITHASSGLAYTINFRVFNNGAAFRYEFTDASTKSISADLSSFVLPTSSTVWWQSDTAAYESPYVSTDITTLTASQSMGPPAVVVLPSSLGYVALTESSLGSFPNPYLTKVTGRQLRVAYPTNNSGTKGVVATGAVSTPWNVIMVASDLNMLMNNDIVESLAPTPNPILYPEGTATSWAKPGRTMWDWMRHPSNGITADNAKTNSYWASVIGYEYNTIDAGWKDWNSGNPWAQVADVAAYSHALGVKVLFWVDYNDIKDQAARNTFLQNLKTAGVDGFKCDYFNSVNVETMQLEQTIITDAAAYQLCVTLHGASKPTGQFRTYPNLLTVEGVYGKEQYPSTTKSIPAPLTRFLAGPADYTPTFLDGTIGGQTPAYEISSAINMPSPLLTFAEWSNRIANSIFTPVLRYVYSAWDESVILPQSAIGQTVASARRKGTDWAVGVMNATTTRSFTVPTTFLTPNMVYQADVVRDNLTLTSSGPLERIYLTSDSILNITAAAGGGFAAHIAPGLTPSNVVASTNRQAVKLSWSPPTTVANTWPGTKADDAAATYSGSWTTGSNASEYNGTDHSSTTTGNTATFSFSGTFVRCFGTLSPTSGVATISIDGSVVASVDCYSATTLYGKSIYQSGMLSAGIHSLSVAVAGTKNVSSSGTKITLDAFETSNPATVWTYNIKRATTPGGPYTTVGTATTTAFSDTTATVPGQAYYYAVTAVNNSVESAPSLERNIAANSLANPWFSTDVGPVPYPGTGTYSGGTLTVSGSGNETSSYSDNFQLIYQPLTGNGIITARVVSLANSTDTSAKAGVMIRENLDPNSRFISCFVTSGSGAITQSRGSVTDGASSSSTGLNEKAPYWVRIARSGTTCTTYLSSNGTSWSQMQSVNISMTDPVYIGLFVSAHSTTTRCTAVFDNFMPATPTGLTGKLTGGTATLSWSSVPAASGYNIKRSATSGGPYTTAACATTTYSETGLTTAPTYYYTVSGITNGLESLDAPEISLTDLYAQWAQQQGWTLGAPNTAFNQDATGSGVSNGVRYAAPKGLTVTAATGGFTLSAAIRNDPAITATVLASTDLVNWTPVALAADGDQTGVASGFIRYSALDLIDSAAGKKFYKLQLVR